MFLSALLSVRSSAELELGLMASNWSRQCFNFHLGVIFMSIWNGLTVHSNSFGHASKNLHTFFICYRQKLIHLLNCLPGFWNLCWTIQCMHISLLANFSYSLLLLMHSKESKVWLSLYIIGGFFPIFCLSMDVWMCVHKSTHVFIGKFGACLIML